MTAKKQKFYITTSIAYTNAYPHIGFALESLQADVIARYHRNLGQDTFFLTGTDEHGSKIAKAAEKEGKEPKDFVDKISARFKDLKEVLNLSNDDFIRTTDEKRHWPSVKKIWQILEKNGDIYKKEYKGLYCVGCEAFITRKDLIDGKCAIHNKEPEVINEENYFFKLSKYGAQIREAIKKETMRVVPDTRANEMLSFIDQGIEDISFSRPRKDLKWGFPVPGDDSQTIYVWADALTNYISAIGYEKENALFKKLWPADMHCIGKDILRFHALIWPGILLSAGLALPKTILVHGHIMSGGQKMSKSLGNVVDPFDLVSKYGADSVRYYLLREIPTVEDGDFTLQKFEDRYNADLAGGIGNLVSRVLTMAEKNSKSQAERIVSPEIQKEIERVADSYKNNILNFKLNESLKSIWELINFCDKYCEVQKPWENKDSSSLVIYSLLVAILNIADDLRCFLPGTSDKIFSQLGVKSLDKALPKFKIKKGQSLFQRVSSNFKSE